MSDCILENKTAEHSRRATQDDERLAYAILRRADWRDDADVVSLSGPASTPAAAQQPAQKPNILFIMGDDIGMDAAEHLSSRPDGRGNAQHRSHRQ